MGGALEHKQKVEKCYGSEKEKGSVPKERRRDCRIECALPVNIQHSSPLKLTAIKAVAVDLSEGGMQVRTTTPLPEAALLQATLVLPDHVCVKVKCRVVNASVVPDESPLYRIGLQFVTMGESERSRIIQYIFKKQLEEHVALKEISIEREE